MIDVEHAERAAQGRFGATLRRIAAFLVVAGIVGAGLVVDEGLGRPSPRGSFVARSVDPEPSPAVPEPGTLSAAWYCAEGTSHPDGRADETVVVVNAGEAPVNAQIRVLLGAEAPVVHAFEVAPRSRQVVRVADLVATPEPGVVVETFGGEVGVEHQLVGAGGDLATAPCARRPGTRWMFSGGTTVKEARDVIALLNPFDDDAIVDMTFFTEAGIEAPGALQSLVVPARSRVSVPVHDHVLRRERVAAEVVATTGRVVAERSVSWDGTTERRGFAVYPGVERTRALWYFPEGQARDRVLEDIWLFNPDDIDTEVEIQPQLDGEAIIEPTFVEVPARSAVTVRMNEVVPADVGHALFVEATGDADVVAAQAISALDGAARTGFAVMHGIVEQRSRWLFPAGAADDRFDEWIVVTNGSPGEVTLRVSVLAGGVLLVPEGLGELEVSPNRRGAFRLGDALKRTDLPILLEADQPVAAVRGLFTPEGVSVSPGIPYVD